MAKIVKNVENLCKTLLNYQRTIFVKLCAKVFIILKTCKTWSFPQTFTNFLTTFPTVFPSLFIPRLFHFSTEPITIITNNLEERK